MCALFSIENAHEDDHSAKNAVNNQVETNKSISNCDRTRCFFTRAFFKNSNQHKVGVQAIIGSVVLLMMLSRHNKHVSSDKRIVYSS